VFGDKITTYCGLAEAVLEKLAVHHPAWSEGAGWTGRTALPGGDFPRDGVDRLAAEIRTRFPFVDARFARHLVRHYGTEAYAILGTARSMADLGRAFGGGLTAVEVDHLMVVEFARTAADVVWRRTKAGLRMTAAEIQGLDRWIAAAAPSRAAQLVG